MGYDCYTHYGNDEQGQLYFRANIWGMGEIRAALSEIWDGRTRPTWPETPGGVELHYDIGELDFDGGQLDVSPVVERLVDDGVPAERHGEILAYYQDLAKAIRITSPESGLVPLAKFGSNDGWWVTEEECETLVEAMDRYLADAPEKMEEDTREFFAEFRDYCRKAIDLGGFHVW